MAGKNESSVESTCNALIVLLTRSCLTTVSVLLDLAEAFKLDLPIVPIVLDDPSRGYDFGSAKKLCENLREELGKQAPAVLTELVVTLGDGFDAFASSIAGLPFIIANSWDPTGSVHHLKGVCIDVKQRLRAVSIAHSQLKSGSLQRLTKSSSTSRNSARDSAIEERSITIRADA